MEENKKKKKIITVEIPDKLLSNLEEMVEETFLTMSGVIRFIMVDYFSHKDKERKNK